ncbi:MAG TPA: M67 family metallopeptidase [Candidatus Binatus sp.]|jgi:proteasome lid subunit RPN8/RPN11|nr:M67 family metallopeptidase [Candidatus Binatus sp.]
MIRIKKQILEEMAAHASGNSPLECCGLLAGHQGVSTRIFPANNALASATAYEIAPQELFQHMREIRRARLELMGIYHSHPNGDNTPSARDIERAYYPDVAYFILSPRHDAPNPVRAFTIQNGKAVEVDIQIV